MSGREWQPGDVGVNTSGERFLVTVSGACAWDSLVGNPVSGIPMPNDRRLAVIDPDDRAQVERLAGMYIKTWLGNESLVGRTLDVTVSQMRAALREFAQPTPPKPEEPLGLGAVVEDASGEKWVRIHQGPLAPWRGTQRPDESRPVRYFRDISVVRVLSEGVTE